MSTCVYILRVREFLLSKKNQKNSKTQRPTFHSYQPLVGTPNPIRKHFFQMMTGHEHQSGLVIRGEPPMLAQSFSSIDDSIVNVHSPHQDKLEQSSPPVSHSPSILRGGTIPTVFAKFCFEQRSEFWIDTNTYATIYGDLYQRLDAPRYSLTRTRIEMRTRTTI